MKRILVSFVIVALITQMMAPLSVFANEPDPSDIDFQYGCCYTEQAILEELHGALLEKKASELQQELGIFPMRLIKPGMEHFALLPSTGNVNMLVLPIAYKEEPERAEAFDRDRWQELFFAPYDPNAEMLTLSLRGFYYQASYGKLDINGTVLPAYQAPRTSHWYEEDSDLRQQMYRDALNYYCDQGLDISQFDNDGDGTIDGLNICELKAFAQGSKVNGAIFRLHGEVNGYQLYDYARILGIYHGDLTLNGQPYGEISNLSTCMHETGHLLGLPDSYNLTPSFQNNVISGMFELMAGEGRYVNPYYKYLLDWIDPIILTNDDDEVRLVELTPVDQFVEVESLDGSNKAVVLIPDLTAFPYAEYYLAEYRAGGMMWDPRGQLVYDEAPGVVIWHCNAYVDTTRIDKPYTEHKKHIKPVYKSGAADTEKYRAGDIYMTGDEFSSDTTPSSDFYDGTHTGAYLKVEEITPDKAMIQVGFRDPNLLPGPVVEVSKPTKTVLRKGETTTVTITTTVGGEIIPLIEDARGLRKYSKLGEMKNVYIMYSASQNPLTLTIKWGGNSQLDDGAVWADIPAGAIRYNAKDSPAVTSEKIYIDNTPPEITLQGDNPQRIQQGMAYTELGAIATDNLDPEIEDKLQIDATQVKTDSLGSYTVTYSVTDHAGHTTTVERTVIVEKGSTSHTHQYSSIWNNNEDNHWHECECGDKADLAAHKPEPIPGQEATCTQAGKTEGSRCSVCKRILVAQEDIPLKEHTFPENWNNDASGHWRECTVCREETGRAVHTENSGVVTKPATEEEEGLKTFSCSVCGYEMRTEVIEKLEPSHTHEYSAEWKSDGSSHWRECDCGDKADLALHTPEPIPGQEATCTQVGKTDGSRCSVCKRILTAQEDIPLKEHTFLADWNSDGSNHWRECTTCHEKVDQAPHAWDGGRVTTAPTSSKAGVKTYTCTVCKAARTESIPATGGGSSGGGGGSTTPVPTEYNITLPGKTVGGRIKTASEKAVKGAKVTLSVETDEGYELEGLTVKDKKGKEVALEEKEGKFIFSMPASNVEVTAAFRKLPKEEPKEDITPPPKEEPDPIVLPFTDVPEKAWYYEAVAEVYGRGIMTGLSETQFGPEAPASRGMVVTMLYRMEGEPAVRGGTRFTDVPERKYYAPAVAWATEVGLVNGYGDNTFRPNEGITREQLVSILYRYGKWKGQDVSQREDLSGFFDVGRISPYARESMAWAKAAGLLNGTDWGGIDPGGAAERGQTAAILVRFWGK